VEFFQTKNVANLSDFTPGNKNSQFFGGQKNVQKELKSLIEGGGGPIRVLL
jgi:hypothetical protein